MRNKQQELRESHFFLFLQHLAGYLLHGLHKEILLIVYDITSYIVYVSGVIQIEGDQVSLWKIRFVYL